MTHRKPKGGVEFRLNDDKTIDEILVYDYRGECLLHIEQMADNYFWGAAYDEGEGRNFKFRTKNAKCHMVAELEQP